MIGLLHYLGLGALLFCIGLLGLMINRQNLMSLLMSIELMLLAISTNFLAFSRYWHESTGEVFVLIILAVAAAESAIGLAIFVLWFRKRQSVDLSIMQQLKG